MTRPVTRGARSRRRPPGRRGGRHRDRRGVPRRTRRGVSTRACPRSRSSPGSPTSSSTRSRRRVDLIGGCGSPSPRLRRRTRPNARLIASVRHDRLLEVVTVQVEADRRHPVLDSSIGGAYDRFRAVHDVLGHARLDVGFDRHGEYAAWRDQERFHSPLARRALATELHGQRSVRWTTGDVAEPKAVLLEPRLVRRARRCSGAGVELTGVLSNPGAIPNFARALDLLRSSRGAPPTKASSARGATSSDRQAVVLAKSRQRPSGQRLQPPARHRGNGSVSVMSSIRRMESTRWDS